jgi:hypothetical protein
MKMNLPSKLQLSAEDRALLAGAEGSDLPALGPPPITLNQPLSPAVLPGDGRVQGAVVGGYVVPWNDEWIATEEYRSVIFAFTEDFREYRPNRGGLAHVHPTIPADARWRDDKTPKGHYRDTNDNPVEDTINCFMLVVNLKPVPFGGVFRFSRSALTVGRELGSRAQRLKVDGENISGMVIGLWEWTSRLAPGANSTSFYLPVPTLLGRLGERMGPTLAQVRLAAQLRQKFKEGLPWAPEPTAAAPEIAAQPDGSPSRIPSSPRLSDGAPKFTSGKQVADAPREQAPPPSLESDYGFDGDSDITF